MAPPPRRPVAAAAAAMLLAGPSNFVLYKILFTRFGPEAAVFVMQGVNLLYVVFGAVALFVADRRGEITPAMRRSPKGPYALMAALDCLGGLFAALGAAGTPGQIQTLLNQSLAPCTMFAGALLLGLRPGRREVLGAATIFLGGAIVVAPELATPGPATLREVSLLTYWFSNVPMALSAVFKEWRFADDDSVHVLYLTQWVSVFQFFFGFVVAPAQCLPGVAAPGGLPLSDMARAFARNAADAVAGRAPRRTGLLVAYVLNNFVLNVTGLVVTQRGGAALSAVLYATLLPLSTLAFGLPFLGANTEPIRATTLAGLLVVFLGFLLYEADRLGPGLREGFSVVKRMRSFGELDALRAVAPKLAPPTFQERTFSL